MKAPSPKKCNENFIKKRLRKKRLLMFPKR